MAAPSRISNAQGKDADVKNSARGFLRSQPLTALTPCPAQGIEPLFRAAPVFLIFPGPAHGEGIQGFTDFAFVLALFLPVSGKGDASVKNSAACSYIVYCVIGDGSFLHAAEHNLPLITAPPATRSRNFQKSGTKNAENDNIIQGNK